MPTSNPDHVLHTVYGQLLHFLSVLWENQDIPSAAYHNVDTAGSVPEPLYTNLHETNHFWALNGSVLGLLINLAYHCRAVNAPVWKEKGVANLTIEEENVSAAARAFLRAYQSADMSTQRRIEAWSDFVKVFFGRPMRGPNNPFSAKCCSICNLYENLALLTEVAADVARTRGSLVDASVRERDVFELLNKRAIFEGLDEMRTINLGKEAGVSKLVDLLLLHWVALMPGFRDFFGSNQAIDFEKVYPPSRFHAYCSFFREVPDDSITTTFLFSLPEPEETQVEAIARSLRPSIVQALQDPRLPASSMPNGINLSDLPGLRDALRVAGWYALDYWLKCYAWIAEMIWATKGGILRFHVPYGERFRDRSTGAVGVIDVGILKLMDRCRAPFHVFNNGLTYSEGIADQGMAKALGRYILDYWLIALPLVHGRDNAEATAAWRAAVRARAMNDAAWQATFDGILTSMFGSR